MLRSASRGEAAELHPACRARAVRRSRSIGPNAPMHRSQAKDRSRRRRRPAGLRSRAGTSGPGGETPPAGNRPERRAPWCSRRRRPSAAGGGSPTACRHRTGKVAHTGEPPRAADRSVGDRLALGAPQRRPRSRTDRYRCVQSSRGRAGSRSSGAPKGPTTGRRGRARPAR